jgi:hypothetical protein
VRRVRQGPRILSDAPTPAAQTGAMSAVARQYLNQLITLMQNNSIRRLTIDWSAFRTEVYDAARDAQSHYDTLPAILVPATARDAIVWAGHVQQEGRTETPCDRIRHSFWPC